MNHTYQSNDIDNDIDNAINNSAHTNEFSTEYRLEDVTVESESSQLSVSTIQLDSDLTQCIICLDANSEQLHHYSYYSDACICNYYVHQNCLNTWVNKPKPQLNPISTCLMCDAAISNVVYYTQINNYSQSELPTIAEIDINPTRLHNMFQQQQQQQQLQLAHMNLVVNDHYIHLENDNQNFNNSTPNIEALQEIIKFITVVIFGIIVFYYVLLLLT